MECHGVAMGSQGGIPEAVQSPEEPRQFLAKTVARVDLLYVFAIIKFVPRGIQAHPRDMSNIYYFKFPRDDYKYEEVKLHVTATQVAESEDEDATHSALETLQ